jgi:hypothetical protein
MATAQAVGAVSRGAAEWYAINWQAMHRNVRRLQVRIVQATKESRWGRVRALQRLLTMTHRPQSAQPLASRLVLALTGQFPCRTDAPTVGVQPQTDQQPRVGVFASRAAFHSGYLFMIPAQVQTSGQLPDRPDAVVFVHKLLDIHASQHKLLAINGNQSRNCPRVVAHERSLHTLHHQSSPISSHVPVATFPKGRREIPASLKSGWRRALIRTPNGEKREIVGLLRTFPETQQILDTFRNEPGRLHPYMPRRQ